LMVTGTAVLVMVSDMGLFAAVSGNRLALASK
jgi:hypothetical protein